MNYSIILHRAPGIFSHKTTVRKTQAYKYRVAAYIIQETKINLCYMFTQAFTLISSGTPKKRAELGQNAICNLGVSSFF